jgi:hypothetical protein
VENARILANFDIIRDAPGKNTPMVVSVRNVFYVTDSNITIDFVEITGHPLINGIEVIYIGPPILPSSPILVQLPTPVKVPIQSPSSTTAGKVIHRINCGSTKQVVTTPNNMVWSPDSFSTIGKSYDTCDGITSSIYCSSRYFRTEDVGPHRYNLPVTETNRLYTVRLHFAEQVLSCLEHTNERRINVLLLTFCPLDCFVTVL